MVLRLSGEQLHDFLQEFGWDYADLIGNYKTSEFIRMLLLVSIKDISNCCPVKDPVVDNILAFPNLHNKNFRNFHCEIYRNNVIYIERFLKNNKIRKV